MGGSIYRDFDIDTVDDGDTVRLVVRGELDLATAPRLSERLAEIEATAAPLIVIDLTGVPFIDSTGLRALLEADFRSRENGSRLRMTEGCAQAQRLFELAGVVDGLPFLSPGEAKAAGRATPTEPPPQGM
ncbi:MAG: STAS domain-containing protein [Solirubrobacteraceae bacterium]